ncbi:MAG: energy transducer TonB [Opitutaceae bacterium]
MKIRLPFVCLALAFAASGAVVRAQKALYARGANGVWRVVRDARGNMPVIVRDGKYETWSADSFAFKQVKEYMPVFVSLRNLRVSTEGVMLESGGDQINNRFQLYADVESPFRLDHVFLVLELHTEDLGYQVFLQEIGDLRPREPQGVNVVIPMSASLGSGKYTLHVYSDGMEVLNSQMPWDYREHVLDRMVRRRIAGLQNAASRPFVGPAPEYPRSLKRKGTAGRAVVAFEIGRGGQVIDPTVASATDPAFGAAALDAVRQWRFMPKVENGVPVTTRADFPIDFSPR